VKDDRVYLQHIQEALRDVVGYCGTDREGFFSDRMRQDATLRKLEVIGQAVKNLGDRTKSLEPNIPWKQIAGMRDKSPKPRRCERRLRYTRFQSNFDGAPVP
jgi:uncharacterized protein with HEPN domain